MSRGALKVKYMKKINKKILSVAITGILITSFANAQEVVNSNEKLSKIRTDINAAQLQGDLNEEILKNLKKQQEIEMVQYQIDNPKSSQTQIQNDVQRYDPLDDVIVRDMIPTEEARLIEERGIDQPVGFKYSSDEIEQSPNNGINSELIDTLMGSENTSSQNDSTDLDKELAEFDLLLNQNTPETTDLDPNPGSIPLNLLKTTNTFVRAELINLYIFEDNKRARIKFEFLENTGNQKRRIIKYVGVEEGKEVSLFNTVFTIKKIDSEKVTISDSSTKKEIILRKK
jgi:hypothetical protein